MKSAGNSRRLNSAASSRSSAAPARSGLGQRYTLVLAVLVVFLALTLVVPLRTYVSGRAELAEINAHNEVQRQRIAELEAEKERLDDPAYQEERARAILGLVEEGETPFRLIAPAISGAQTTDEPVEDVEVPGGSWYEQLWSSISTPPELPAQDNEGRREATSPDRLPTVPTEEVPEAN